jgi:hypothetical protein
MPPLRPCSALVIILVVIQAPQVVPCYGSTAVVEWYYNLNLRGRHGTSSTNLFARTYGVLMSVMTKVVLQSWQSNVLLAGLSKYYYCV